MMTHGLGSDVKTIAITGGARGIGFETAKELIRRGHRVAIGDIDEAQAKEAASELGVEVGAHLDVTAPEGPRRVLGLVGPTERRSEELARNHHCRGENRASRIDPRERHLSIEYAEDCACGLSLPVDRAAVLNGNDPSPGAVAPQVLS